MMPQSPSVDAGGEVVEGALDRLPDLLAILRFGRLQGVVENPLGANLPDDRLRLLIGDEDDGQVPVALLEQGDQLRCRQIVKLTSQYLPSGLL
jgi:hypothetical protein